MRAFSGRALQSILLILLLSILSGASLPKTGKDPLPSWNEGKAKEAILAFVRSTTTEGSPDFVPFEERIATFDQDGTLMVEYPRNTQVRYSLDRVPFFVKEKPEFKDQEPFKTALADGQKAIEKLKNSELFKIEYAVLNGMSVETFYSQVGEWIKTAKDPRWNCLYTDLAYQPMQEVLRYLQDNGYKTYIVSGSGQDFVRVYSKKTFGIPRDQVIGTTMEHRYTYDKEGRSILIREPHLLSFDNTVEKPERIQLHIGRRPLAAFGNSDGDREMLEYCHSGEGKRLALLILHDDSVREYAYGPAQGLPEAKTGAFSQALYDEAQGKGWFVVSMKDDWKRIFSFEKAK